MSNILHVMYGYGAIAKKIEKRLGTENNQFIYFDKRPAVNVLTTEADLTSTILNKKDCDAVIFHICLPTTQKNDGIYTRASAYNYLYINEAFGVCSKIQEVVSNCEIILHSTVAPDFFDRLAEKINCIYIPEFSVESTGEVYRHNTIIGVSKAAVLEHSCLEKFFKLNPLYSEENTIIVGYKEAAMIKLLSNYYLHLRACFFNEVSSACDFLGINQKVVIEGITEDSRIGKHYCTPTFGVDGPCLPKDARALEILLKNEYCGEFVPMLMGFAETANKARMKYLAHKLFDFCNGESEKYVVTLDKPNRNFGSAKEAVYNQVSKEVDNLHIRYNDKKDEEEISSESILGL